MSLSVREMFDVLALIEYKDWEFGIRMDGSRKYLQVRCRAGACNVTGKPWPWSGRKWLLSRHMTRSELVQTALKAVLTAEEHEAREKFLYRGQPIFDPHFDVERLVELRRGDHGLEVREEIVTSVNPGPSSHPDASFRR